MSGAPLAYRGHPRFVESQLGSRLKVARKRARLSQEAVAARLGIQRTRVSEWETGMHRPNAVTLQQLADLYGTSTRALLNGEPDASAPAVPSATGSFVWEAGRKTPFGVATPDGDEPDPPEVRSEPSPEPWSPNPAFRAAVPARAYDVAMGYMQRLVKAGLPLEQLEELERHLLDNRYARANSRRGVPLSEEDQIGLIDANWELIRDMLSFYGVRA